MIMSGIIKSRQLAASRRLIQTPGCNEMKIMHKFLVYLLGVYQSKYTYNFVEIYCRKVFNL